MKNMMALLKIEYIFTKRNIISFVLGIGLPVGLLFLITAMFESQLPQVALDMAKKEFLISMTVYSSLSFAVFTFPYMFMEDRNNNWYLFIKNSPVKMWQYYLGKMIRIMVNFAVAVIVVFAVGRFLKGITMSEKEWIVTGLLILMGSIFMLSAGFLLTLITSEEKLSAVANIAYIALGMIGGLWWPLSQFPLILQRIGEIMPTHHVRELAVRYIKSGEIAYGSILVLMIYAIILIAITLYFRQRIEKR